MKKIAIGFVTLLLSVSVAFAQGEEKTLIQKLSGPEIIDTGRQITAGEYSGIKGFRNVYDKLEVKFMGEKEATKILELVRYANVHTQKPLIEDELLFIAKYPEIARKIFTMSP